MKKLLGNQLLFGTIVAFMVYWTLGAILPNPIISTTVSFLLLLGGGFASWKYVPPAFEIVALNRRVDEVQNERDYYPVYGSALLAIGSVYSGLFGLVWASTWMMTGIQPDWSGTALSSFGRALMAGGFLFLFLGPSESKQGIRLPNLAWLLVVVFLCMAASFVVGLRIGSPDDRSTWQFFKVHGESRILCPHDKPYWISSSGKIHGPYSRWRSTVIPRQCFQSQSDAMKAGFTAAQ